MRHLCSFAGCPTLLERPGRCPEHDPARDPRSSRNHRGIPRQQRGHGAGYDRAARELRGQPCAMRLPGCLGTATGGNFLVPVSEGGTIEDGLEPACSHCQSVQGGQLAASSRRR